MTAAPKSFRGCSITFSVAVFLAGCTGVDPLASSVERAGLGRVDRRTKAHAPAPNAGGATAEYFGGPVTPNAKVYVIWWGDPSTINSAITAAKGGIADFYEGITNSSYFDWLNQYDTNVAANAGSHMGSAGTGQLIGRGNYAGTFTLANVPSGTITDTQIRSALDQALAAGSLPQPDDNALYAIYFAKDVSIVLDGTTSCHGYGGYHDAIIETQRHDVYYIVIPDCGSSFASITSVSSHELIEALSDSVPTAGSNPDYPQAWNDSMGDELGDLCEGGGSDSMVTTPVGMFTVQNIWDERTMGCKAFSPQANDFDVSLSPNVAMVPLNVATTFTVQTETSAGTAQMLTLSATAPAGFTATVSPTTVNSGSTATLTVTATDPTAFSDVQVVVRADATTGSVTQTHTAALLVGIAGASPDFSGAPVDLATSAGDLAQPSEGSDAGAQPDLSSTGGVGGGGGGGGGGADGGAQMPPASGCGCVVGAAAGAGTSAAQAMLVLLALAGMVLRRRRR